jgi:Rrf2 family nitric oxide-sensitive transcriptional repressor
MHINLWLSLERLNMRVTRFTDIGLRILMYLYQDRPSALPVTVAEMAMQFDTPANHVVKVVGRLAKLGMVLSTRGRHGGVKLAPVAASAGVGALIQALEGEEALIDCDGLQCRLREHCRLRGALQEGLTAFYTAMDRYTLADIAGGKTGEQIIQMHQQFVSATQR